MMILATIRRLVRILGFDVVRFTPQVSHRARRQALWSKAGVTLVLDIGANVGQYATMIRLDGYAKDIYSVEPLTEAFALMEQKLRHDRSWRALNVAVGPSRGRGQLHVSQNSQSSSFLDLVDSQQGHASVAAFVRDESVTVVTLADVLEGSASSTDRVALKLDVQGSEEGIIRAHAWPDPRIVTLELEVSLEELYRGEWTYQQCIQTIETLGYRVFSLEPAYSDPVNGRVLQVNIIFVDRRLLAD